MNLPYPFKLSPLQPPSFSFSPLHSTFTRTLAEVVLLTFSGSAMPALLYTQARFTMASHGGTSLCTMVRQSGSRLQLTARQHSEREWKNSEKKRKKRRAKCNRFSWTRTLPTVGQQQQWFYANKARCRRLPLQQHSPPPPSTTCFSCSFFLAPLLLLHFSLIQNL